MTIANSILLADNAFGTIASGLTVSDTTLTFTTGHGARFPVVAAGQILYLTLLNSTNVLEVVKVTAHTSGADTATMVRAANGTAAKTWSAGDRVEARWTSEVLRRLQDEAMRKTVLSTADSGATYTGSMDFVHYGYVTGLIYHLTAATTNNGTTPTINLDSLGAVTVVLDGGGALAASQMPVNGLYAYDGTNFILLNPADDEGTWTATEASSGGSITTDTNANLMSYTKVGRQVTICGEVTVSSVSSPTGNLTITGLPYANQAGTEGSARVAVAVTANGLETAAATQIMGLIVASASQISVVRFAAGAQTAMAADVKAGATFSVNATYFV